MNTFYSTFRDASPAGLQILADSPDSSAFAPQQVVAKLMPVTPIVDHGMLAGQEAHIDQTVGEPAPRYEITADEVDAEVNRFLDTMASYGADVVALCSPEIPQEVKDLLSSYPDIRRLDIPKPNDNTGGYM